MHHKNSMFRNVAKALGLVAYSPPESVQSNNVPSQLYTRICSDKMQDRMQDNVHLDFYLE